MRDSRKTHLEIGVVTKPHGLRGELKVRLHFEQSTALSELSHLILEMSGKEAERFEIESLRGSIKGPILALIGVDDRNRAEELCGAKIWAERGALPELGPGEYYLVDLVGCEVRLDGSRFGVVKGVRPDPSVDTMIVTLEDGEIVEVPILDAWVGAVDVKERTVELLSEDGIIR